jgi:hypothetical protein
MLLFKAEANFEKEVDFGNCDLDKLSQNEKERLVGNINAN